MHSSPCSVSTCVVIRRRGSLSFMECSFILCLGLYLLRLRSQGWSPFDPLDSAARFGARVAHYSETRLLGGLDSEHLRRVKSRADSLGIRISRWSTWRPTCSPATSATAASGACRREP